MTQCNTKSRACTPLSGKKLAFDFDGGEITSYGGTLLLREAEKKLRLFDRVAEVLLDKRTAPSVVHTVRNMLAQRVMALCMGCEDLNDHSELRNDPAMQIAVADKWDKEAPLASPSTLCRWEKSVSTKELMAINGLLVDIFLDTFETPPEELILDFDATDCLLFGNQEGRHFNSYYDDYCYTPLYVTCGSHLLFAYLREAFHSAAHNTRAVLKYMVKKIRARFPDVKLIFRGDSAYGTHKIMHWCETNKVHYIVGFNHSYQLDALVTYERKLAHWKYHFKCESSRTYTSFEHTGKNWFQKTHVPGRSNCRRSYVSRKVVCRAEHTSKGGATRFVVTNLSGDAQSLYEDMYCARGDMENRIKENKLFLFACRTSSSFFCANQLRLLLSGLAYVLMNEFRRTTLVGTDLASAQCDTIREKIVKIGARVSRSVRRVLFHISSSYPFRDLFVRAWENLRNFGVALVPQRE